MTYGGDGRDRLLSWALTASLAALPLGWIHLGSLGGFDMRLSSGMVLLLGAALMIVPGRLAYALRHMPQWSVAWLTLYALYLLVLSLKLAGLPNNGIVVRQIFFVLCALTVGGAIVALRADPTTLRRGGLLGILGFMALTETVARANGLSWTLAVERFLWGDLDFLIYGFFRELFRIAGPDGIDVPASEKNAVAVALLTVVMFYRAAHSGSSTDWSGRVMFFAAATIILLMNTRSVLVVMALALVAATLLRALRERPRGADLISKGLLALGAAGALGLMLSEYAVAFSSIQDRFAFDDASSSGRLDQLRFAVERIEGSVLLGTGLAEINGQLVHNLFLGAWMHAGLPAFLLITTAYAVMLCIWLLWVLHALTRPTYWVLPVRLEWVAVLPMLFFFRVWVAGDAGHPGFGEWIGFVSFKAFMIANTLARRGVNEPRLVGGLQVAAP